MLNFDPDDLLRNLPPPPTVELAPEDTAFLEKMLRNVRTGSKALMVVLKEDGGIQYMLFNTADKIQGAQLVSQILHRLLTKPD